jgi:protein SCO1/2
MRAINVTRGALAIVTMCAVAAGASACARGAALREGADASAHELAESSDDGAGVSIFDLDLHLTDQDGRSLTLADLDDQVMVAAMVYTSCTSVCLRVTEEMKKIEQQLSGVDRDVRYVLFSLDPGRDTPEAMRQFARAHHLDTNRWRLVAASEDGVRDLAAVFGVKYQAEENGEIAHSAMVFVIDADGVVRHRQVGVGQDPRELVAAVRRARG